MEGETAGSGSGSGSGSNPKAAKQLRLTSNQLDIDSGIEYGATCQKAQEAQEAQLSLALF